MKAILKSTARRLLVVAVPLLAMGLLVGAIFLWGPWRSPEVAGEGDVWTCSMHPQVQLPKPGSCPICGMDLVPLSELKSEQARMEQRQAELIDPIQQRVQAVIEGVRAELNLAMIFDVAMMQGAMVAADRSLDVTPLVIQRLQAAPGR